MQRIPAAGLPVTRWPNGAGRKSDLISGEGWLVSYAWLDADAPFSHLPGLDRTTILIEGPGFTLDVAGRGPLPVRDLFQAVRYDGGAATTCHVLGPCRVLNVMSAQARFSHTTQLIAPPAVLPVAEGATLHLVALLAGAATLSAGDESIAPERLDAVRLAGAARIAGTGATLCEVRIEARN